MPRFKNQHYTPLTFVSQEDGREITVKQEEEIDISDADLKSPDVQDYIRSEALLPVGETADDERAS